MSLIKRVSKAEAACLLGLLLSNQAAMALPSGLVGKYMGYDPLSVQRGVGQVESQIELAIGKDSLHLTTPLDVAGRRWTYQYTDEWIDQESNHIKSQNSLFTKCMGLRGAVGSRQLLCFHRFHSGENHAEVTLHPSEDLKATTGIYFMKRLQLLDAAYASIKQSKQPEPIGAWEPYNTVVPQFDFEAADRIMANGDPAEKYILFKRIADRLWARSPAEIERLINYLQLALNDSNSTVQAMALNSLMSGYPVVQSLTVIFKVLKNPTTFPHTTAQRAAAAALALLAQGRAVMKARITLDSLYGTSDLDDIYKKTGGNVGAAARGSIETLMRLPEQDNTWDISDRTRLLTFLLEEKGGNLPYFRGIFAPQVQKYKEARQGFSQKLGWMSADQMQLKLNDGMKNEVISLFKAIKDTDVHVRQWTSGDIKALYSILKKTAANAELHRSVRDTILMSPLMKPCESQLESH